MREIRRSSVRLAGITMVVCLAAWPTAVIAQPGAVDLWEGNPALAKVSSHLLRARALAADGKSVAQIAAAVPSVRLRDGLPEVEIRMERLTPDLVEELRGRGLLVDSFHLGYGRAYGRLDPADLDEIAGLVEVVTIQPMPRAGTRVGAASNQADVTMNTDDVRSTLGHNGTGVEVGVLSDSFRDLSAGAVAGSGCNRTVTGTSSQTSGDLPNGTGDVVSLDDGPGGGSDEARAIGELMFDIAPGADFSFHSAFNSPADFAGGITELVGCGADLIVDDVFWTQQAFFQDDVIAQAAQMAVDNGVPYFSAAGNDATFGVDEIFADTDPAPRACNKGVLPNDDDLHDFGGGDHYAKITIPDDCNLYAELQWAEPFDSIGAGVGATTDLDLFLLATESGPFGQLPLDLSITSQGGVNCGTTSGDPLEFISYDNTSGGPMDVFLAVDHCCGNATIPFRIVTLSFNCGTTFSPWNFEDGGAGETSIFVGPQIFGHPAARDVVAVAATFYGEIDFGGALDPPPGQLDVEPYSSLGGDLPFYFDDNGGPLPMAPLTRAKPEITGPDGTNTTFFGADIGFDPDTDPNFFGTSAAAPNSAAIAALILDATDLNINPLPLRQLLSQGSLDMEGMGPDNLSGSGFTDGLRPLRSVDDTFASLIDDLSFDLDGGSFLKSPSASLQPLQANNSLFLADGDYTGIEGTASNLIFADGFESGDTSAWSN